MRFVLPLIAAAGLILCSSAAATPLSYTFDSNNQGWMQNQDPSNPVSPFLPAGFLLTSGDPGGHLTAKDTGSDSGCPSNSPCELLTFYSPVVSPLGANYGGIASFDLRSPTVVPAFAAEMLLLAAGDNYLDGLLPESATLTYNHLSIPLTETANWAMCPYAGGTCAAPSQDQFKSLIGATDQIAVIADVGPNGTNENYDLDNVTLTEGAPAVVPPPAVKKCKKKKHGRASAAKKKKCKKKKKRSAAVATFRG
jgi:hypothetical protein